MASFWSNTSAESGILRKNDQKDKLEDLLVFGYACKLFRDDEKAKEIDKGKHLIPWMGDNTLKIDRYDGRGTLSDLIPYEASREGYDATRWLGLSESERKIEQLCDEERYFSLHTNEEDDELYKEEAQKRSKSQTNQIQYNYEESPKTQGPTLPTEEDDEPFIPPPDLDLPIGIALPSTVKQNARIEKTALFISKEGPQMEILLKTKQSGNVQFGFLTQENELYRYYRHVLMAIKTGRYKMSAENSKIENDESKEDSHYLHPSLLPEVNSIHPVPQISYKPSADCAYRQLIQRIQGHQPTPEVPTGSNTPDINTTNMQAAYQQHYIQHYQQYGYYPNYDQNHPYFAQFGQYGDYQAQAGNSNPYAQIVSNLKTKDDQTGPNSQNGFDSSKTEISKAPVLYGQKNDAGQNLPEQQDFSAVPIMVKTTPKPLLSLAEYSDSDNEESDDENDSNSNAVAIVIPPNDIQIIIDKMAAYVAKNGADFETIVKSKGDTRFIFLEVTHPFHPYYKYKLKECLEKTKKTELKIEDKMDEKKETEEEENEVDEETTKKDEDKDKKIVLKSKEKKIITPVSFSIKKPQTTSDPVSRDKSALPVEDSTDDEEQIQIDQSGVTSGGGAAICGGENQSEGSVQEKVEGDAKKEETKNIIEIEDSIMELIDLTEELEEKRDKRAEDRLKDKIAAAAREKLAEKNRALQMERKKRAAAFLSQLKPQSNPVHSKPEIEEVKTVRLATPEAGEITPEILVPQDLSRMVYHIERSNSPQKESVQDRSRSNSTHRHKSAHRKRSHKRSHSHTSKRKRERRSRDRKKSKRRHSSKSRSKSPHKSRSERKENSNETDKQKSRKKREKSLEISSHSSDYCSDSNYQK